MTAVSPSRMSSPEMVDFDANLEITHVGVQCTGQCATKPAKWVPPSLFLMLL